MELWPLFVFRVVEQTVEEVAGQNVYLTSLRDKGWGLARRSVVVVRWFDKLYR